MNGDIDIDEGGREVRLYLALDALILVLMAISNPI